MRFRVCFLIAGLSVVAAYVSTQELTTELLSGLELRNIGPANMSGRFVDLAVVESDPYIYYAASATGGVFKTTNNGVTFEPVFEKEATHSVGDIAVHQKSPDIVWVGTGERANRQSSSWGDGVYKSTDAGETWTNVGLRETRHIGRIVLHPESTDIVYVAAMGHLFGDNEERGLYKSSDGGATWQKTLYIDAMTGVVDVAMDPGDPNILYAATYQRQRKSLDSTAAALEAACTNPPMRARAGRSSRTDFPTEITAHRDLDLSQRPEHRLCLYRARAALHRLHFLRGTPRRHLPLGR